MGPSGLPLPRFVCLKSDRVNLRIGPGRDYPVQWLYVKPGLPVEIIQEYDNWRRIRDADGTEGWVLQTLLTGKRSAIAAPWGANGSGRSACYGDKDDGCRAKLPTWSRASWARSKSVTETGAHFETAGHDGYVKQTEIWGAYPGERLTNSRKIKHLALNAIVAGDFIRQTAYLHLRAAANIVDDERAQFHPRSFHLPTRAICGRLPGSICVTRSPGR